MSHDEEKLLLFIFQFVVYGCYFGTIAFIFLIRPVVHLLKHIRQVVQRSNNVVDEELDAHVRQAVQVDEHTQRDNNAFEDEEVAE